jgi:hypothetical protein
MTRTLTITFSTLLLAGCANNYNKSAGLNDCKLVASADHPVSHAVFGTTLSTNNSLGGLPGRDLAIGSGRFFSNDTSTHECAPDADNKGKDPQTGDLQKIGAVRSSGIEPRPV